MAKGNTMEIKDFTKQQLWALREEIVLNSLYKSDFENSMGIDRDECYAFFDGYVDYLCYLYEEAHNDVIVSTSNDLAEAIDEFDSIENLWNYRLTIA